MQLRSVLLSVHKSKIQVYNREAPTRGDFTFLVLFLKHKEHQPPSC